MYSFHFYGHYFFTMIIICYLSYLISTVAIHPSKYQLLDQFNITTRQKQHQQRYRRFITWFDNTRSEKHYQTANNSPLIVNDGQQPIEGSTTKDLLETLGHQTNRVIKGAADAVLTPFNWISHMSRYWPLYLVCITIILGLIAFLYCACQSKIANFFSNPKHDPFALLNFFQQQRHRNASPGFN